jgi:hypothetical protein
MKKNGKPFIYTSPVINTYNAAADCKLKYFDSSTGYFEAIEYFSSTSSFIMHALVNGSVTTGDIITIEDFQIAEKTFITPFTPSSRGITKLQFNLNRDIGLDWSKDWSIVYFKKPIATATNDKTWYNIDSIGCNSNTVGGGYIWWGKYNGSNIITNSTPSTEFDPNKYFDHWRMISLVKSGTNVTIKEWSPTEGIIYVRTGALSTTVANYYVTQYGYDLMIGGWDNTYASNSYYRDLIVAQRAFTDDELKMLINNFISTTKDSLRIQDTISENITL